MSNTEARLKRLVVCPDHIKLVRAKCIYCNEPSKFLTTNGYCPCNYNDLMKLYEQKIRPTKRSEGLKQTFEEFATKQFTRKVLRRYIRGRLTVRRNVFINVKNLSKLKRYKGFYVNGKSKEDLQREEESRKRQAKKDAKQARRQEKYAKRCQKKEEKKKLNKITVNTVKKKQLSAKERKQKEKDDAYLRACQARHELKTKGLQKTVKNTVITGVGSINYLKAYENRLNVKRAKKVKSVDPTIYSGMTEAEKIKLIMSGN